MGEVSEDDVRRAIGAAARKARNELRLTQAEVAASVGVAEEVYGRIERGLALPSVPTLLGIATVLRISPDQLLGWTPPSERTHPEAYERILSLLEGADESSLKKAYAVLHAVLKEPPE